MSPSAALRAGAGGSVGSQDTGLSGEDMEVILVEEEKNEIGEVREIVGFKVFWPPKYKKSS